MTPEETETTQTQPTPAEQQQPIILTPEMVEERDKLLIAGHCLADEIFSMTKELGNTSIIINSKLNALRHAVLTVPEGTYDKDMEDIIRSTVEGVEQKEKMCGLEIAFSECARKLAVEYNWGHQCEGCSLCTKEKIN